MWAIGKNVLVAWLDAQSNEDIGKDLENLSILVGISFHEIDKTRRNFRNAKMEPDTAPSAASSSIPEQCPKVRRQLRAGS
jgi:hypothetical protein